MKLRILGFCQARTDGSRTESHDGSYQKIDDFFLAKHFGGYLVLL
jgi:hypothetical protein